MYCFEDRIAFHHDPNIQIQYYHIDQTLSTPFGCLVRRSALGHNHGILLSAAASSMFSANPII